MNSGGNGDANGDGMRQLLQAKLQQRLGNQPVATNVMHYQQAIPQPAVMSHFGGAPSTVMVSAAPASYTPASYTPPAIQIQIPNEFPATSSTISLSQPISPMIQVTTPTTTGSMQWINHPPSPGSLAMGTPGTQFCQPWGVWDGRTGLTPATTMTPGWTVTPGGFGGGQWE